MQDRLNLTIDSVYKRSATELTQTIISYQAGELEELTAYANDGRNQHEVELRFLVEVPTSVENFDLEALDAASRIEREINRMNLEGDHRSEPAVVVANMPSKFSHELGVFARTVTVKQKFYMGSVEEELLELGGTELTYGDSTQSS
ncbi:hypothetical protein [Vibrio sp. TRT 17S01]|uniref:hypothetical protein n=1 Tax=Vibrio sp. TRT 17S01 TaxID=3418505 RepID=UPI003CEB438F